MRIEVADEDELELGPGDMFSLAPGVETTWHVTPPFREMWVFSSETWAVSSD